MQLWKKNYIVSVLLIALIINTSMFFLIALSFQEDYKRVLKDAVYSADNTAFLFSGIYEAKQNDSILDMNRALSTYEKGGQHAMVLFLDEEEKVDVFADTLPYDIAWEEGRILWQEEKAGSFFFGVQSESRTERGILRVLYLKDVTPLHITHYNRIIIGMLIVLVTAIVLEVILYKIMKQIYKPIDNIAHELRTPLTGILGYAQYVKSGRISGEDIYFAGAQIEKDAQHLHNIVEKLLVMGNVREGHIRKEVLPVDMLLAEIKAGYPTLEIQPNLGVITGDKTLLTCMIRNIVDNAARAGQHVFAGRTEDTLWIANDGEVVPKEIIMALNQNRALSMEQIKGNGYGLSLCHEIARIHQLTLLYEGMSEGGIKVHIKL